jgi:phage-related protein
MSTNVGEIDLSLILNSDKFNSQLKNVDSQANSAATKISSSLSKIGKAALAAFSVAAVVKFGKECLRVATETSNAWIGLNSILTGQGRSFDNAKKFIQEYVSDGLVPLNNAVAAYKNLALRGYSSDQIEKTMTALKNSATFARQSTYSLGDAVQTATEGLKNENSVVVDNAGVTKNVAKMWEDYAKSIGKTTNQLTQAEKIQAEVNGILEETKFQSNDAAIYASTYSGKLAQLNTAFTNLKTAVGNVIQPIAKLFIPIITTAVNAVTRLFTALSGLLSLFGLKADSVETVSSGLGDLANQAGTASDAVSGVGDSAKKAGKEAKKASNNLASFDNLNVLPKDTDSSSGSGSGSSGGGASAGLTDSLDVTSTIKEDTSMFDSLIDRVKELAGIFKKGFEVSFGDTNFDGIKQHLGSIKDTLIEIWTDPKVLNSASNWVKTVCYSLGQAVGAVARIGTNIVEGLVGSIDKYLSQNKERIKTHISNMFDISSKDFALTGNLWQALGEISDVFKSDTAKQIGTNIIAIFANPFMSIQELCGKFVLDLKAILFQPIIDNADKIKTTIENTMKPIESFTSTLANAMTYVGDKWNEVYDQHIHPLMEALKTGISDTFGKFLDAYNTYVAPMLERLATKFNELWNTHLKPFVDNVAGLIGSIADAVTALWNNILKPVIDWIIQNILPVLVPIFESLWNTICNVFGAITDTIGGIIQTFKGLIDFIVGIFTGDWNKAWEGIKTFFTGIWNAIKGVVSTVWNAIKGIIETVINTIKGIITTVFNAIKTVISNIFNGIKNTVSNIWNGIKNSISNAVNSIKNGIINNFQTAYNRITSIFRNIGSFFSGIWNNIKNTFSALGTKIGDAISGAVKSGINGVLGMIEGVVNKFVNMINGAIDLINNIPGVSIGKLNQLNLPRLAQGGYVKANTPQLAVIGDNKNQGEVVAPEDKMLDMILTALRMFNEQNVGQNNNSQAQNITLKFDGSMAQLIRVLKPELDKESKRKGSKLILGGAT